MPSITASWPSPGRLHRPRRGTVGLVAVLLVAAGGLPALLPASPAAAAPGDPGTPAPPAVVYDEDFENGPATSPIQRLNQYTGASGQTYTADPAWLVNCNGWVASAAQDPTAAIQLNDCLGAREYWNNVQQLSQALGILGGESTSAAAANHAVSAYTASSLNNQSLEFATASNVPLPTSSRFLAFSVDVAAVNCDLAHPLLQFQLVNPQGQATPAGARIDGCSSPTTVSVPALGVSPVRSVVVGRYTTSSAVLFSGASVGIRLLNQPVDFGNDHAFDNIQVLDATPQLDTEFVDDWAQTGGTTKLRFTITNTSELGSKQGWSFSDSLPAGLTVASPSGATTSCPGGSLSAAGGQISLSGNLDVGMASCTVEVSVTAAAPGVYVNGPDRVSVVGLNAPAAATATFSRPGIALTKTAGSPVDVKQDGLVDAGDTIPYAFELRNTGDVPLSDVTVDDALLPVVPCPAQLAPGATATCSADYTITAADAQSGSVRNVATARGTAPGSAPAAVSPPSSTTTAVTAAAPGIALVKSVDPHDLVEGEDITYSFAIENTGNLPLHDVGVTEQNFSGSGPLSAIDCPTTELPVGHDMVCTATYTVTAADLLAGTVDNTATASGTPLGIGAAPVTSEASTVELPAPAAPSLRAVKSASPGQVHAAGDEIAFSVGVENDGNMIVDDLSIADGPFTGTGASPVFACEATRLVPGEHTTCTAVYRVTQADVDSGGIHNTANASGRVEGGGVVVSPAASTTVTVDASASLSVVKTTTATAVTAAGQVVPYAFTVRNAGGVTVRDLAVSDVGAAPAGALDAVPACPTTTLAPGESVDCTGTYTVTQADVDYGSLSDTATATGTTPSGASVVSESDTVTLPVDAVSRLTVAKRADVTSIQRASQVIGYTFTVTNSGATTVNAIAVADTPVAPAAELTTTPDCPVTTVAPGESVDCTATYTVTQADLDHGSVADSATASGTDAHGTAVTSPAATLELPSTATASLTLSPQPTPASAAVGDAVPLTFVATNTGDLSILDVAITEGDGARDQCTPSALGPGETATCTTTPIVGQADMDAGALAVTATATGSTHGGEPVSSSAITETVPVSGQVAGLSLTKTANVSTAVLGQTIEYTFSVRNTGTVTLTELTVVDTQAAPAGPLAAEPLCDTTTIAPDETATCTAVYSPAAADLANGVVTDTAVAHAETTLGDPVTSDPSTLTLAVTAGAGVGPGGTTGPSALERYEAGLASTGSDAVPPVILAALALLTGVIVRVLGRRRRA